MIQWQDTFTFLTEKSPKNRILVYIMHGEFSESFADYAIFICKFKTVSGFYSNNGFRLQVGDI